MCELSRRGTGSFRCPNRIAGTLYRAIIILGFMASHRISSRSIFNSTLLALRLPPLLKCHPRAPISVKTPTRRFAPKAIDPPPALTPSASDVQGSLPGPSMSPSLLRKGKQPSTSAPFTSFSRAGPSNQPKRARSPVESIDISLDLSSSQTAHSTTGWSSITGASGDSSASKDIKEVLQDDDGGDYITPGPIRPPSSKRRRAKTAKA